MGFHATYDAVSGDLDENRLHLADLQAIANYASSKRAYAGLEIIRLLDPAQSFSIWVTAATILASRQSLQYLFPDCLGLVERIYDISSQKMLDSLESMTCIPPPRQDWLETIFVMSILVSLVEKFADAKALEIFDEKEAMAAHLADALVSRLQLFWTRRFPHNYNEHAKMLPPSEAFMFAVVAELVNATPRLSGIVCCDHQKLAQTVKPQFKSLKSAMEKAKIVSLFRSPLPDFSGQGFMPQTHLTNVRLIAKALRLSTLKVCGYTPQSLAVDIMSTSIFCHFLDYRMTIDVNYNDLLGFGTGDRSLECLEVLGIVFASVQDTCMEVLGQVAVPVSEDECHNHHGTCAPALRKVLLHVVLFASLLYSSEFVRSEEYASMKDWPDAGNMDLFDILYCFREWRRRYELETGYQKFLEDRVYFCWRFILHDLPMFRGDIAVNQELTGSIKIRSRDELEKAKDGGDFHDAGEVIYTSSRECAIYV